MTRISLSVDAFDSTFDSRFDLTATSMYRSDNTEVDRSSRTAIACCPRKEGFSTKGSAGHCSFVTKTHMQIASIYNMTFDCLDVTGHVTSCREIGIWTDEQVESIKWLVNPFEVSSRKKQIGQKMRGIRFLSNVISPWRCLYLETSFPCRYLQKVRFVSPWERATLTCQREPATRTRRLMKRSTA